MGKDKEYLTEEKVPETALTEQEQQYLKQKKVPTDPHGRQDVFVDRRDPERAASYKGKNRRSKKDRRQS